jgi:hypothetical protein
MAGVSETGSAGLAMLSSSFLGQQCTSEPYGAFRAPGRVTLEGQRSTNSRVTTKLPTACSPSARGARTTPMPTSTRSSSIA